MHIPTTKYAEEKLLKEKEKSTVLSILISFSVLFLLGAVLAFSFIALIQEPRDLMAVYSYNELKEETVSVKRPVTNASLIKHAPPSSSLSPTSVIPVGVDSVVSLPLSQHEPAVESLEFAFEEGFGADVGFERGLAGETSFFHSKIKGNRICYVIDYSASMHGERDHLMREELKKSVKMLKGEAQYNLIFFSGPVWQAGDQVTLDPGRRTGTVVSSLGSSYQWEVERHQQDWQPQGQKQRMEWRKSTSANLKASLSQIEDTPLLFGTYWENPLMYALEMTPKPDVVVFMTDGACGAYSMEIAERVAKNARRSKVVINTVSLMEPDALHSLIHLSEETGGTAIMVKSATEIIDLREGEAYD